MTKAFRILFAAVFSCVVLTACSEPRAAKEGEAAIEVAAMTLDGAPVDIDAYRGKVVLVNFWMTGCGPCLKEMPILDTYYRTNKDRGFEVLGVNMGDSKESIKFVLKRFKFSFPLLEDPLKITSERWQVEALPTSFIIDRQGIVVRKIVGPLDEPKLEQEIGRLLDGASI
ncbi:TlpA family protein disulfide reductase [Rhodomicrobium sp.]|uniref:TlpA family protein disulfide reductase n=1 Tax=Rhodomicrobium sp. TaxID=2720632 RepID=UPI0039E35DF8